MTYYWLHLFATELSYDNDFRFWPPAYFGFRTGLQELVCHLCQRYIHVLYCICAPVINFTQCTYMYVQSNNYDCVQARVDNEEGMTVSNALYGLCNKCSESNVTSASRM